MNSMPKMDDMYDLFLEALADGKEHLLSEVEKTIIARLQLPEEVVKQLNPSGGRALVSRITWAGHNSMKAGLAKRCGRGIYQLTDEGKRLLAEVQAGRLHVSFSYLKKIPLFSAYIQNLAKSDDDAADDAATDGTASLSDQASARNQQATAAQEDSAASALWEEPEKVMAEASKAIERRLEEEVLEQILLKDFRFFEQLVVRLLEAMGYGEKFKQLNHTTPPSNDGGIDALVFEDRLGFNIIYAQAKRYQQGNNVDLPKIHEFIGALCNHPGVNKGLFITTSNFTQGAIDYAKHQNTAKLVLINGKELAHLMVEHGLGVTTTQTYAVRRLDLDFFNPDGE